MKSYKNSLMLFIGLAALIGLITAFTAATSEAGAASNDSKIEADSVKQPYRSQVYENFQPGISNLILHLGTVPANKRLVLEHVSAKAAAIGADVEVYGSLDVDHGNPNEAIHSFHLEMKYQATDASVRFYTTSQPIKAYLNEGEKIFLNVGRTNANFGGYLKGIITGYLVDVP